MYMTKFKFAHTLAHQRRGERVSAQLQQQILSMDMEVD